MSRTLQDLFPTVEVLQPQQATEALCRARKQSRPDFDRNETLPCESPPCLLSSTTAACASGPSWAAAAPRASPGS
jgi:hypothetical protein